MIARSIVSPIARSIVTSITGRQASAGLAYQALLDLSPVLLIPSINDARAEGKLWQDSAMTTPATAVDDPVGAVEDFSGNARHLTSSSTARPLLKQDGNSNWYLDFDGTNDIMAWSGATPCATAVIAMGNVSAGGFHGWLTNASDQGGDVDFALSCNASPTDFYLSQAAGAGLQDASHIWVNQSISAALPTVLNAIVSADGTGHPGELQFPTGVLLGQDRALGGRYGAMDFYGLSLFSTILAAEDRAIPESYMASQSGITL